MNFNRGLMFILSFVFLLSACGTNSKNYEEDLLNVQLEMISVSAKAEGMLNMYANLWSRGIKKERIMPDELAESLGISEIHLSEYFNVQTGTQPDVTGSHQTLVNSLQDFYQNHGEIDELEEALSDIKSEVKKLNNPPKEYEEVFDRLLEMYSLTEEIAGLAKNPSGSLITFNEQRNQLSDNIVKLNNEIEVLLPNEEVKE